MTSGPMRTTLGLRTDTPFVILLSGTHESRRSFSQRQQNKCETLFELGIIRNSVVNSWVTLPPSLEKVQSTVTLLLTTSPRERLWVMASVLLWRGLVDVGRTARRWLRASERFGRMLGNTVGV